MYSFIKNLGFKKFLIMEMPALGVSLAISEMAYKFGSFLLECGAFLTTWYLISLLANRFDVFKKR